MSISTQYNFSEDSQIAGKETEFENEILIFFNKLDIPLIQWLQTAQNIKQITDHPIQSIVKLCIESKIGIPVQIEDLVRNTSKIDTIYYRTTRRILYKIIIQKLYSLAKEINQIEFDKKKVVDIIAERRQKIGYQIGLKIDLRVLPNHLEILHSAS